MNLSNGLIFESLGYTDAIGENFSLRATDSTLTVDDVASYWPDAADLSAATNGRIYEFVDVGDSNCVEEIWNRVA